MKNKVQPILRFIVWVLVVVLLFMSITLYVDLATQGNRLLHDELFYTLILVLVLGIPLTLIVRAVNANHKKKHK